MDKTVTITLTGCGLNLTKQIPPVLALRFAGMLLAEAEIPTAKENPIRNRQARKLITSFFRSRGGERATAPEIADATGVGESTIYTLVRSRGNKAAFLARVEKGLFVLAEPAPNGKATP